ncbi:unnamed protein product [Dracunculus medinensis]|uniref:Uncharacterized protein n=1 Tax=Dracunculus medinensis TaxID=318479 RepID=A0A0N4UI21_DRAME|nr:unnamed protein product [Dracunculus medinensis]
MRRITSPEERRKDYNDATNNYDLSRNLTITLLIVTIKGTLNEYTPVSRLRGYITNFEEAMKLTWRSFESIKGCI